MSNVLKIAAFVHQPPQYNRRSGMAPLAEALGAHTVYYEDRWHQLQRYSWRIGALMSNCAKIWYGSGWNYLLPMVDELKLAWDVPQCDIAHFLFGEFASPRHPQWFRRKAKALVGTFHASARRLPSVLGRFKGCSNFDAITLMSESQRAFFCEKGVPEDRLAVILHGVDTKYFVPDPMRPEMPDGPLRGLLVGSTERDHAMMAEVLRVLPKGILEMTILTAYDQRVLNYADVPHAVFPEHLSDVELLKAYQQSDILIMPMQDCTANNAVLESMACGTPVMVNRVGGIPEYVDPGCNDVIETHTVDAWVDRLLYWHAHRVKLAALRPGVRKWAEQFDWSLVAPRYFDVYKRVLSQDQS